MHNLNLDFIKANVSDDPEFIQELLEVFLSSLDTDVPALEDAIHAGEHEAIRKAAHKVKSGFRSLGMQDMTDYLQNLEDMGKQGADLTTIQKKFNGFMDDLPAVRMEINDYIEAL
jgi:HPt (histidine-containing phosphotransfer) domain-containing protein